MSNSLFLPETTTFCPENLAAYRHESAIDIKNKSGDGESDETIQGNPIRGM